MRPGLSSPVWYTFIVAAWLTTPSARPQTTAGTGAGTVSPGSRPNIILAMADDLGWGDVGYQGNQQVRTPHLDALARAGLRFDRFYAPTVCSPTRGSCLTGRHPYRYGIFSANVGHLPTTERTLAEYLRERGYRTGHFGKWHLGTLTRTEPDSNRGGPRGVAHYAPPWEHGFETTFSTEAKVPTWDPMLKPRNAPGSFWDALARPAQGIPYGTAYWSNGQRVPAAALQGDDSRLIMDQALDFIDQAAHQERPFFAVIWFHAPHLPVVAGPAYAALYPNATPYERNYFGCITALDDQIGRLRSELRRLGVARDTLLWFCSDNGPEGQAGKAPGSTGPFRGRKRDLWEGGIRVPGLLEWPAVITEPRTVAIPCVTSDFLPTVLDLLGLAPPANQPLDGLSLRPLFEGRMAERPSPIGFEFGRMAAWIDNRHKLVAHLQPTPPSPTNTARSGSPDRPANILRAQLFDILTDPGETNDLAAARPELTDRLRASLETWRASCRVSLQALPP